MPKPKTLDLTKELRSLAKRLQEAHPRTRPHRAASDMEAFDLIQAEATRLLADTAFKRGVQFSQRRSAR